jgi:hypothetical protein
LHLTPPSRGRPAGGPPLTSNVRQCELKAKFMPHLPSPAAQYLSLDTLSQWERRARFSVSVGCPPFGGQRTVSADSSLLLASLVTSRRSSLFAKRPRRLPARSVVGGRHESLPLHGRRAWPAPAESVCKGWPNFEHQMPEVSTRQRRASWRPSRSLSAVAASRSGHLLAQPGSPNRSVKGTSRKRAAPYVER